MLHFPPELTDRIIDQLDDDKPALKICGLVCSQWYPRSRVHVFSQVYLRVGHEPHYEPDNVEAFFDLVDTSSFDILASIRYLLLRYQTKDALAKAHLLRFAPCSQLIDLGILVPYHEADILAPLYSQLIIVGPKLSSLSHYSFLCGSSALHELLGILACLPAVETLSLNCLEIYITGSSTPVPPFPPRLRCLAVNVRTGTSLFFKHLISLPFIPQLRSLHFHVRMDPEDCAAIARYLQHAGTALQSLEITLPCTGTHYLVPGVLNV
jgi:hypothetical protein